MKISYDLHTHSHYSDGDFSPEKVVGLAKEKGLSGAAITDHDTILGWSESKGAMLKFGMPFVQGVEISTILEDLELHVLGYSYNFDTELLKPALQKAKTAYLKRLEIISQKLRDNGIADIDISTLQEKKGMEAILTKYDLQKELALKHNIPMSKSCDLINKKDGLAYAPHDRQLTPSSKDVIDLIYRANGFSVLAHPGKIIKDTGSRDKMWDIIKKLVSARLCGLEISCLYHSPELQKELLDFSSRNMLLKTGGSDYHGPIHAPYRLLGLYGIDDSTWQEFHNRLIK
ncbi:MAG: PHP domain-containing protein [Candidatus Pacebacteria bacterium]|nr:PHP domain-containing protein [Candidatus Paceibacterota bacterium]